MEDGLFFPLVRKVNSPEELSPVNNFITDFLDLMFSTYSVDGQIQVDELPVFFSMKNGWQKAVSFEKTDRLEFIDCMEALMMPSLNHGISYDYTHWYQHANGNISTAVFRIKTVNYYEQFGINITAR